MSSATAMSAISAIVGGSGFARVFAAITAVAACATESALNNYLISFQYQLAFYYNTVAAFSAIAAASAVACPAYVFLIGAFSIAASTSKTAVAACQIQFSINDDF